ncbi:MAG: glycosyltransferase family 4 protein [Burkholderiaceae bacterium]|nr:MAG: glycosyltransferase family 4 protein [Burkholderiaceae bacterium]
MKLLYIDHYAGGPAYGMEYRPFYLAREWVRCGHQVTIVAATQAHVRSRQPVAHGAFTREVVDGVSHVWCRTPRYQGNGVGRVINIAAFLRRLRQWRRWLDFEPDVVIASSTYPADIGPARAIARAHSAMLVWEVHDLWPLSPIELGGMSRRHPFVMWMQRAENIACGHSDLVVSMLPLAEAHLREHGLPAGRFVYAPNGIDPQEWSAAPVALPAAHAAAIGDARGRGDALVAYAGSHGLANDLGSLIDAASRLKDEPVTWLLVGTGPEKAALERKVAQQGLARVKLLDPVPKACIPELLRQMDLLYLGLLPHSLFRFGISPNKLMDYMMAGRPVVCAVEAGNDPVGEAGCGVTVPPGNPQAIADAVRRLASMPGSERDAMGERGRAYVLARHTYPVLAHRFIEAIQLHERARPLRSAHAAAR